MILAMDPAPAARDRARRVGADQVFDVGQVASDEFAVALEASGAPASLAQLLRTVAVGGTIVQLGNLPLDPIALPLALLVSHELDLRGAFRFTDEMDRALAVLRETPAADDLITHTFPLERVGEAFAVAADGGASCKVMLEIDAS